MIQLEPESGRVMANGVTVRLSPRLFTVFEALHGADGKCVPRDGIGRALYGSRPYTQNSIRVAVLQLRRRLGAARCRIESRYGFGYCLTDEAA